MKINAYIADLVIVGYVLIRLISSHTANRCRWFDFILTASAGPNVVLECDEIANIEHLTYRMRFEGDRVAVEDQYHKYIIAKRK